MKRLVVQGAWGRMGQFVCAMAAQDSRFLLVAGADRSLGAFGSAPIYSVLYDLPDADVLVDFSSPAALENTLAWCTRTKTACVLCATGYSPRQMDAVREAAQAIPIFQSANMSLGVQVLARLARQAAILLGPGFDIEIVEAHHKEKKDAPSGTALLLAGAVEDVSPHALIYGRGPGEAPRTPGDVGIHAVRGGTIAGTHTVLFAGPCETLTLTHSAQSREVFAAGALAAADFLAGKPAGYYTMEDLIP